MSTTIEHYKELWEYINHSLFSKKRKTSKKQDRKLYIDDETVIIVTKQLPAQYVFECKVVEDGCEGGGTLDVLNINDLDFFNIVYRTARFIESWELTFGPKLIRDARKLLDDQRAAAQQ